MTYATPGALRVCEEAEVNPLGLFLRHGSGDWGEVCEEDRKANEAALKYGSRLLSVYSVGDEKLWIITEAVNEQGLRWCTTLLRPDEY